MDLLFLGGPGTLGRSLKRALGNAPEGTLLKCAVGYISPAGVRHVRDQLGSLPQGNVEIIVGIDFGENRVAGIRDLSSLCGVSAIHIFHRPRGPIFHPKVYCLLDQQASSGRAWIGSGNWTDGGFALNEECVLQVQFAYRDGVYRDLVGYLARLRDDPCCLPASEDLLRVLERSESELEQAGSREAPLPLSGRADELFLPSAGFAMTLAYNDVSGRRFEKYFLIPVAARDANPAFWQWPGSFGHPHQRIVDTVVEADGTTVAEQKRIYYVPERDEFRYCSPAVYNLGAQHKGHLLYAVPTATGYRIRIIPPGDCFFYSLVRFATREASRQKRWGYVPQI